MGKIREELEIVSSDDLNSLLNRLDKLKNDIKDTNNTTVKPKTDSSEIDKANAKLDNLRKNAQNGIEAPVKLKLDASDIKKLNNLTAKAKVNFLVDKGAISKSIGKDLNDAIQTAYSKINNKTKNIPVASPKDFDKFLRVIPELTSKEHSGMMQALNKRGLSNISGSELAEFEKGYRLRNYINNGKKSLSTNSGAFAAPDISLSAAEYSKALSDQITLAKNMVS